MLNDLIAYEQGDLDFEDALSLFSTLVENGMAWSLQGHYGRTAATLIEQGLLDVDGTITDLGREF